MKFSISLNQFAEFSSATEASKKRILKQQLDPNKFLIPWYQLAKSSIKKFLKNINSTVPIKDGIEKLINKVPVNKRQLTDKAVSIEALKQVLLLKFPNLFKEIEFEIIKPIKNSFDLNGVEIIVAPDVVLKGIYRGGIIYGAVKIHICKSKPFSNTQGEYVATLLYQYLKKNVLQANEKILPELCLSIDVFANRVSQASVMQSRQMEEIRNVCNEIKLLWAA